MLKAYFVTILFAFSFASHAVDRDVGNNGNTVEYLNGLANDSKVFVSGARQWIQNWPVSKLSRSSALQMARSDTIVYCLKAGPNGRTLVEKGDKISKQYEAYMAAHPDDGSVNGAYQENDSTLHALFKQYVNDQRAAHCQ